MPRSNAVGVQYAACTPLPGNRNVFQSFASHQERGVSLIKDGGVREMIYVGLLVVGFVLAFVVDLAFELIWPTDQDVSRIRKLVVWAIAMASAVSAVRVVMHTLAKQ